MRQTLALAGAALLLAASASYAESATVKTAAERSAPTGHSTPKVVRKSGFTSASPSLPETYVHREFGAFLKVEQASARARTGRYHPTLGAAQPRLTLRLQNGRPFPIKLGRWTRIGGKSLRITRDEEGYMLESLVPKGAWRLTKNVPPPPPPKKTARPLVAPAAPAEPAKQPETEAATPAEPAEQPAAEAKPETAN